jgi:hypothetical protein
VDDSRVAQRAPEVLRHCPLGELRVVGSVGGQRRLAGSAQVRTHDDVLSHPQPHLADVDRVEREAVEHV